MTDEKEIPPYVPSQKEQADITRAIKFRDDAYNQTRQERQEWRTAYFRYKLSRYLSEYEYVPDVQLGLTYDAVERTASALPGREFGFKARPAGPEDTKNALLFSEVLNHAWNSPEVMDGPNKMDVVKKNMALFGSCFVQTYWETKTDKDGNIIKSDPCFWPLNIFDVYYNKFIAEVDDLPEIGYMSVVSLDWLKKNGKTLGYKNIKYVKGFDPKTTGKDDDSSAIDAEETMSGKKKEKNDLVKIFEIQSDEEILTIALDDGQPVWLRKIPNQLGCKNVVLFRLKRHPLPNRLLGITDVTKGGYVEDAIQRQMNQAVFNALLVDNPNFTYDATDRHIDPRTFVTAPGAGIPRGRNADALTPISFPSHLNDSLALVNTLFERYKRIVNTPDVMQGIGDTNADTATATSILDANSKAANDKIVDGMKNTMQKLGVLIRKLYEAYGADSVTVKLRTPELLDKLAPGQQEGTEVEMPKEDLVLERDIDISVEFTSQNKSILSRRLVEWLSLTAKDQTVPPQLRLKSYQKWLEFNDLDDLAMEFSDLAGTGQTSDLAQAEQENQQMAGGQQLPPTPNASVPHTQRHIDFMRRADTGPEVDRLLQAHIEGELQAHQGGMMQPGQEQGMEQPGMEQTEAPMQTQQLTQPTETL